MMSRDILQAESHEKDLLHDGKGSARSIRSLDTAVLMTEKDWRPKSRVACETWRSEATVDTGLLLQDPETFVSGGRVLSKPRYADVNKKDNFFNRNPTATSESQRVHLSEERNYFENPGSSYTKPVYGKGVIHITDRSNVKELNTRIERRSMASEMDDFVNSSGSTTLRTLSPSSSASLDTNVLLNDPDKNLDYRVQTGHYGFDSDRHSSSCSSELDENDSSVGPLDDLVSARTVASLTTEVLLKPTEELAHVLGSRKTRKTGRPSKEAHQVMPNFNETSNLAEFEMSSSRAMILDVEPIPSRHGMKSETSLTLSDKLTASQHLKTKPEASNSVSRNYDMSSSRLSSQRCFSDLVLDDGNEVRHETASSIASNGEGPSRRGTRNSVEHARKFAQRDNTQQSDTIRQRSMFNQNQIQRSKSATRSGITSPSSVLESPRSVETGVSLGQRIVRKSQENEMKMRQRRAAASNAFSRSFMHDDESSSISSQKSLFHEQPAKRSMKKKKRSHTLNKVQEDMLDDVLGLAVKGNPVQPRPLSSSSSLQEVTANEWTRRKKYNPRQSLQTEAFLKKTGKPERKMAQRNGTVKESESGQQSNNNRVGGSIAKNGPSTSSDWSDEEEQQLIPCGRDLSAVCQMSARVKQLSGQVLQVLRKRSEFGVNEMTFVNSKQMSSDTDSLENSSPEFLYIIHNLEAAERQLSAVFEALSSER